MFAVSPGAKMFRRPASRSSLGLWRDTYVLFIRHWKSRVRAWYHPVFGLKVRNLLISFFCGQIRFRFFNMSFDCRKALGGKPVPGPGHNMCHVQRHQGSLRSDSTVAA